MKKHIFFLIVSSLSFSPLAKSEPEKVTKYIIEVQEERRDTRWTLTEWLRIKERMKMMDLWLAMMNDPAKSKFRPEFSASYYSFRGTLENTVEDSITASTGTSGRAELWLTNLISGTIGIRTLNIDLGVEGFGRKMVSLGDTRTSYAGSLRLFGKNIQDSSLTLKYGVYQSNYDDQPEIARGRVLGGSLQLYILRSLGAEGTYYGFVEKDKPVSTKNMGGTYYEYFGFIEVSLLRLMVGAYQESWLDLTSEKGTLAGVKLQF